MAVFVRTCNPPNFFVPPNRPEGIYTVQEKHMNTLAMQNGDRERERERERENIFYRGRGGEREGELEHILQREREREREPRRAHMDVEPR